MGGVVAYEMGRQLLMKGERVEFVVMIDSYALGVIGGINKNSTLKSAALSFLENRNPLINESVLRRLEEMQDVDSVVRECYRLGFDSPGTSMNETVDTIKVLHYMDVALNSYCPPKFNGDCFLLLADQKSDTLDGLVFEENDMCGWRGLVDPSRVINIGGDHHTIMQPPYIQMVADIINSVVKNSESARKPAVERSDRKSVL